MSDVTTEAAPVNSKPLEPGAKSVNQNASRVSGPRPDDSPAAIDYPPLEMAEPVVFWYNPFKK